MGLIIVLLLTIFISMVVNRIATVALSFTGMSKEMARFQARSAFSTVGFTTSEAESVVRHPVRRRIIMLLMLMGNVGLVTVLASLMGSVVQIYEDSAYPLVLNLFILVCGLVLIWALASSTWLDHKLSHAVTWALNKYTRLEAYDFMELLNLEEGYIVTEMSVEEGDWLVGRKLSDLRLADGGVHVLGLRRRDGEFAGAPTGPTFVRKGDIMILYGAREDVVRLDVCKGDATRETEYRDYQNQRKEAVPSEEQARVEDYIEEQEGQD
jgi:K+/H+ antiporter YhaU regulatory subunit KhtT